MNTWPSHGGGRGEGGDRGRWVSPLIVANGQLGKALKRTSHEVSLQQTGETWNSVAIYTNFSILENEI